LVYQPDCRENLVCVTSAGARQPHDFGQILSPITRRNALSTLPVLSTLQPSEESKAQCLVLSTSVEQAPRPAAPFTSILS
jgi:hypothetical protein